MPGSPDPAPLSTASRKTPVDRLREWLFPTQPEYSPSVGRRLWLTIVYILRRWLVVDRCTGLAASLTVETLLSMVPITSVVLFFVRVIDPGFGRKFLEKLFSTLVPEGANADRVTEQVIEIGSRANVDQLGVWGLLVVIVLAYWLFSTLESTANQIWRIKRTRHLVVKFPMFYTIASLAPIVVLYSLAQPVMERLSETVLVNPYVPTTLGLIVLNRFMPNTRVSWRAAVIGGVVSATLFELGKFGFGAYVSRISMDTYESVYGTLAVWPVFLVWVYLSWMIVLLGLEVSFVVHHDTSVRKEGYVPALLREEQLPSATPGRTAARLMLAIADQWARRRESSTVDQLNDRFGIGVARTSLTLDLLEQRRMIVTVEGEQGYIPGMPLDQITVSSILGLFAEDLPTRRDDELGRLFSDLDAEAAGRLGDLTLHDLVMRERESEATSVTQPGADEARST